MNFTLRCLLLVSCVLLIAGGCRQADRVTVVPPTRAELPTFEEVEARLPISVGVAGAGATPQTRIVPEYREIELTPQERAAIGEPVEPEPDVLAFYRPPRGPEHGVSAGTFAMRAGIGGLGGPSVGHAVVGQRFGRLGLGGVYAAISSEQRAAANVGPSRTAAGIAGHGWGMSVGESRPRKPARSANHTYR